MLRPVEITAGGPRRRVEPPPAVLEDALDWQLVERARPLLERAGSSPAGSDPARSGAAGSDPAGSDSVGSDSVGSAPVDGAPPGFDPAGNGQPEGATRFGAHASGEDRQQVRIELPIRNRNRCVGGILSSHIARACGAKGLPEDSIVVEFEGSAGQSFGGWLAPGVNFALRGDANDYAGKGLSGGVLAVSPRSDMGEDFVAEQNVIVGNTVLYGATAGRAFFRGLAGERFAVRNSGASTVVEGVGDHGCEYMTGGRVVVLGPTGRNFAAGMSGGVAYVLDERGSFAEQCNMGMVGLDPLEEADALELRALIEEHAERTGSPVATRVLGDWEGLLARGAFVKVMPHDYKRVLRELAEQAEGVAA